MLENHQREQYFWTDETVSHLANIAGQFENPCCLCAPLLGQELERRGTLCSTLDVDERFSALKGFQHFDVYRPMWQTQEFGALWCDPPFWIVSLSQLFTAICLLARHDYEKPLAICYPSRRGANLMATFHRFGLEATGYFPAYKTVDTQENERSRIEFFANFPWS
ncbi:hypothetical protein IAD21_04663 [Abditibacteriota bacterium]|nr:hypothetical protein IAD21_04663 [Abditibacteriota bacterium]